MSYICFHPLKLQYFFPERFSHFPSFLSFYKPYTFAGQFAWWLWRRSGLLRNFCRVEDIEKYVPEKIIRNILGEDTLLSFNLGTPGPEQKITVLGIDNGRKFFMKFAESSTARVNVKNEGNILEQLRHLDFVPQILQRQSGENFEALTTSLFEGERYPAAPLNEEIFALLLQLRKIKIDAPVHHADNLHSSFAHGDFCPWNLIKSDSRIKAFDWEMAGIYPEGYDLFYYIFQTSFLLTPKKIIPKIIYENRFFIDYFFAELSIDNWQPYLKEFARIKIDFENKKRHQILAPRYSELLRYAEKA